VNLIAPPYWTVDKSLAVTSDDGQKAVRFTLRSPETTSIREVDLVVTCSDLQGNRHGELYYRAPVSK
jgi:hypothetical protein